MTSSLRPCRVALCLFLTVSLALPFEAAAALLPAPQTVGTQAAPPPNLKPSTDSAINAACGLDAVKKNLAKLGSGHRKKAVQLIRRFNSCVEARELSLSAEKPMMEQIAPLAMDGINLSPPQSVGSEAPNAGASAPGAVGSFTPSTPNTPADKGIAQQHQFTQGEQLTGSAWGTPDACAVGTSGELAGRGILFVHRALVLPRQATDDFGYRLGKRFLVYQVSITNAATNFQYAVSDIVVNLKPIFDALKVTLLGADGSNTPNAATYEASSQDLLMLRGVPEKGQDYDPRNMTLHILQGVGAVGAGVSGLTPFSNVMGSAMANFNGAFLQAFTGIAPDHTSAQLNRLSDMAFTSNTLIGKLQTKKFAIFIPEELVMPKEDRKTYWKDPRKLLNKLQFDQLNVCVDGILLVQAATTPDPVFSTTETNVAPATQITLTDSDSTATIYFTTNGDTPTTNSSKYSSPIVLGALATPALTVKAFAVSPNKSPSNTVVASFTPAEPAAKPTLSCATGMTSATLAPTTQNDTVFYTEDGTTPSRTSKSINSSLTFTPASTSEKITAWEVGNSTSISPVATCP